LMGACFFFATKAAPAKHAMPATEKPAFCIAVALRGSGGSGPAQRGG
jgi:hypothetical protein